MTSPTQVKQVLAVIPVKVGGRAHLLASPFSSAAQVTVVETTDEDKAGLAQAHVILTGLGSVTAKHIAAAPALELINAPATASITCSYSRCGLIQAFHM